MDLRFAVDDHGHVLVALAGVPPHVLVDADHLGGYAEVVVTCTSRDVPSDHLLEELRNEGLKVHDFRAQAQRRRDGKTF